MYFFCEPTSIFCVDFKKQKIFYDNKIDEINYPMIYIKPEKKVIKISLEIFSDNDLKNEQDYPKTNFTIINPVGYEYNKDVAKLPSSLNPYENETTRRDAKYNSKLTIIVDKKYEGKGMDLPERKDFSTLVPNLAEDIKRYIGFDGDFVNHDATIVDYKEDLPQHLDMYQYMNYICLIINDECKMRHFTFQYRQKEQKYFYDIKTVTERNEKLFRSLQQKIKLNEKKRGLMLSKRENIKEGLKPLDIVQIKHPLGMLTTFTIRNVFLDGNKDAILSQYVDALRYSRILIYSKNPEDFFVFKENKNEIELKKDFICNNIKLIVDDYEIFENEYYILYDDKEYSNFSPAEIIKAALSLNGVLRNINKEPCYSEYVEIQKPESGYLDSEGFLTVRGSYLYVTSKSFYEKSDQEWKLDLQQVREEIDINLLHNKQKTKILEDYCSLFKTI